MQGFQDKLGALQGPQSSDKPLSQAGPSGTQQFTSPHSVGGAVTQMVPTTPDLRPKGTFASFANEHQLGIVVFGVFTGFLTS